MSKKENLSLEASLRRPPIPRNGVALVTPPDAVGAKQSFKTDCDINFIMSQYQKTGAITHFTRREPTYGYAEAVEFREALEIVRQGTEVFQALPSSLRAKFENDPARFLEFVQDPANADEMLELGLRKPQTATEAARIPDPATGDKPVAAS